VRIIVSDKLLGFDKGREDNIAVSGTSVSYLERKALPSSYDEEIPLQSSPPFFRLVLDYR